MSSNWMRDATSRQLHQLIQEVNIRLVHVIVMGLSCSQKQLFAAGSTAEVKQLFKQMQNAYTSATDQSTKYVIAMECDISILDAIAMVTF